MSPVRRFGAGVALLASAAVWLGWLLSNGVADLSPLFIVSGLVAAAVGLTRRSLLVQVASRAVAWVVFVPCALAVAFSVANWHTPELVPLALAATSLAALILSRPMLFTESASTSFSPIAFRRWFLASSTAGFAASVVSGVAALELFHDHALAGGSAVMGLSLAYAASSIAVLRMRGWGVLLGGAVAAASVVVGAAMHDVAGAFVALGALPGLMLAAPILAARLRPVPPAPATQVSISAPPPRVRIAAEPDVTMDEEGSTFEPAALRNGLN